MIFHGTLAIDQAKLSGADLAMKAMKPFVFKDWHAWQGTAGILLSDERAKTLRNFDNIDAAVNWLFVNDYRGVARALNAHKSA